MKKIFLLCLVCLAIGAKAQNQIQFPLKDSTIVYENTVKVDGTADKLFKQAEIWTYRAFRGSKSYLTVNDKVNLKLVGKGFSLLSSGNVDPDTFLTYTIDITIKNGEYSYKVNNVGYLYGTTATNLSKEYSQYLHGEIHKSGFIERREAARNRVEADFVFADQTLTNLIVSLKRAMLGIKE